MPVGFWLPSFRSASVIIALFLFGSSFFFFASLDFSRPTSHSRRLLSTQDGSHKDPPQIGNRLLYIVTSIHEFDIGRRETTVGYNRFSKTLVPVIREAVASMVAQGYNVDVYLIAHYKLSKARHYELVSQLPPSVGLQVWDEASPIAYRYETSNQTVDLHTRGLSRQHRYVIKDKIFYYDYFVNFEDDMLVRGQHVAHYVNLTQQIYNWRLASDGSIPGMSVEAALQSFHGPMTKPQLGRTIPGFLRVETALSDFVPHQRNRFDQIPVAATDGKNTSIDASVCCHVEQPFNEHILPRPPTASDLYFWETAIDALGVRRMPDDTTWAVLLGGSNNEVWDKAAFVIGDYWSGRAPAKYFHRRKRPDRKLGRYMSNQGGWIATRRQIVEWHERWCRGNFLPPYDLPFFMYDGLDLRSVEYWSGGIQLVGVNSCNMQRIVPLDPDGFSSSLLFHTSNNKQRQRPVQKQFSGRNINEFWGQLNTIQRAAEDEMGFA